jgi:hypothetical protein
MHLIIVTLLSLVSTLKGSAVHSQQMYVFLAVQFFTGFEHLLLTPIQSDQSENPEWGLRSHLVRINVIEVLEDNVSHCYLTQTWLLKAPTQKYANSNAAFQLM